MDKNVVSINFDIVNNRPISLNLFIFYSPTDIPNWVWMGWGVTKYFKWHTPRIIVHCVFYSNSTQKTWKMQTSDHNTQKKNSG